MIEAEWRRQKDNLHSVNFGKAHKTMNTIATHADKVDAEFLAFVRT